MPIQFMNDLGVCWWYADQIVLRPEAAWPFKPRDRIEMPIDALAKVHICERKQIDAMLAENLGFSNCPVEPIRKMFCNELRRSVPGLCRKIKPRRGGLLDVVPGG